jgi:hypothetical protein
MKVAAPPSDAELPHFDALLKSGTFHERLERARQQRERILAAQANDAAGAASVVTLNKPWEQPRKGDPKPDEAAPAVTPAETPQATAAPQFALVPVAPANIATAPEAARLPTVPERVLRLRTAVGFVMGLAVGAAVAWIAVQRQPEGVAEIAEPPAAAAGTGSAPAADDRAGGESGLDSGLAPTEVALLAANYPAADPPLRSSVPDPLPASAAPESQPLPASHPPGPALAPLPPPGLMAADDLAGPPARMARFEAPTSKAAPDPLAGPAAQDLPPPPPAAPVPAGDAPPVRVHILLQGGADQVAGAEAAAQLQSAGFRAVETAETGIAIRETNVRFYHGADAAAAAVIAEQLGTTARDFTAFSPRPPQGLIEVWLKSGQAVPGARSSTDAKPAKAKPAAAKPKKPKAAPPPAPSEAEELQALRDRVLMQLLMAKQP